MYQGLTQDIWLEQQIKLNGMFDDLFTYIGKSHVPYGQSGSWWNKHNKLNEDFKTLFDALGGTRKVITSPKESWGSVRGKINDNFYYLYGVTIVTPDDIETMLATMAITDTPDAVADISNPDYYVSPHGSDTNNGTSASTPWLTPAKVNSINHSAGSVIAFERGGEYYGFIDLGETKTTTGTEANRVVFTAYGTGAKPVIHGWKTLSGWVDETGGKYSVTDSDLQSTIGMLILNGARRERGRYPKKGVTSGGIHNGWHPMIARPGGRTHNELYSNMSDTPNFNGGQVVVNKTEWLVEVGTITAHSGQLIRFSGTDTDWDVDENYGFFVQNHVNCLTAFGDWTYDGVAKKLTMFFGAENPVNHQVRVTSLDYTLNISNDGDGTNPKKFITFNNLGFQASNKWGANISSWLTEGIRFEGCDYKFNGGAAIQVYQRNPAGAWRGNPKDTVIDNCLFEDSASSAIKATHINGITITDNVMRRTFLDYESTRDSCIHVGQTFAATGVKTITGNRLYYCGYMGINYIGSDARVENNIVYHWASLVSDSGGIYDFSGKDEQSPPNIFTNRQVIKNIVVQNPDWTPPLIRGELMVGIYHDERSINVVTTDNVVMHATMNIFGHSARDIECKRNLLFNAPVKRGTYGRSFGSSQYGWEPVVGWDYQNNVVYGWDQSALWFRWNSNNSNANDITLYGTFNNNYYINPGGTTVFARTQVDWGTPTDYTLSQFKSTFGMEVNSEGSPTASTASAVYVNPQRIGNLVVNIGTGKIDKDGNALASEQTLAPFEYLLVLG